MKFKWEGLVIRESTRSEDLATAKKIPRMRRSKLAIGRESHLRIGVPTEVEAVLCQTPSRNLSCRLRASPGRFCGPPAGRKKV